MSDPDDKGIHKHCAGPVAFAKIEYDMVIKSGKDEPIPFTDLLRATHMRKDGTYVEYRAKSIVEEVEQTVSQLPSDGSPNATNQTAIPSHTHLINQTFLEDVGPNETSHASLARNLDTELRLSSLETTLAAVKDDMAMLKNDVLMLKVALHKVGDCAAAMQASQNVILIKEFSLALSPIGLTVGVGFHPPSETEPSFKHPENLLTSSGYPAGQLGVPCQTARDTLPNSSGYPARQLGIPCRTARGTRAHSFLGTRAHSSLGTRAHSSLGTRARLHKEAS
ncbi:putative transposase Ptta/En/Spm plant [Arabidopsis suecica]|uniref:Putative transposase Ptta/En/Spm plant n=1 Tax=Arabidopsis suecica TaxID=45249 RepID=A0A8T2AJ25_ARASU|nr:putative transposase Ptta/En/Spm plant [Arabidopsis suecica]